MTVQTQFTELLTTKRRALGLLVAVLVAASSPALAGPSLFSGVGKQAGGIVGYPTLFTTISGPSTGAPGVASVTTGGEFTIPAAAFSRATPGYTFTLAPVYPYVYVRVTQRNAPGVFANNYLTPSVPVAGPVTNTATPFVASTPRAGLVRVTPGANGFGGNMAMTFTKLYRFDIQTSLGILKAKALDYQTFGGTPVGGFAAGGFSGGLCCSTYPSGSPSLAVTAAIGSSRGPWVTGMAYARAPNGAVVTTTTQTAADARSAFDTGVISLVTPRIQYVYSGTGAGTLVSLRDSFGIIHSVDISFAPEPGQLALLAGGLGAVLGLHRLRRSRV